MMMSAGINLVMTVIGFAVSTLFIVFICTRLICARIHFHASRRSFLIGSRSDFSTLERGLHGLEPVMVANFPTKKYSDEFFSGANDSQCTVCLAEYHKEDILRILPSCGHYFHASCIDIWLYQHSTCPVCRLSLREFLEKKRTMQPLSSTAAHYHYGERPFTTHSHHVMISGHGFSPRPHDDRMTNTNHEDIHPPQVGELERTSVRQYSHYPVHLEARENICPIHDCYHITVDQDNICPVHGRNQTAVDQDNFCPVHGCNQSGVDQDKFCPLHGRNQIRNGPVNIHTDSQSNA